MRAAVHEALGADASRADALLMCAAVGDFRPDGGLAAAKLKRERHGRPDAHARPESGHPRGDRRGAEREAARPRRLRRRDGDGRGDRPPRARTSSARRASTSSSRTTPRNRWAATTIASSSSVRRRAEALPAMPEARRGRSRFSTGSRAVRRDGEPGRDGPRAERPEDARARRSAEGNAMKIALFVTVVVAAAIGFSLREIARFDALDVVRLVGAVPRCSARSRSSRFHRDGTLKDQLRIRAGDFTVGFVLAALVFAGAWVIKRTWLLTESSPKIVWLLHVGARRRAAGIPLRPSSATSSASARSRKSCGAGSRSARSRRRSVRVARGRSRPCSTRSRTCRPRSRSPTRRGPEPAARRRGARRGPRVELRRVAPRTALPDHHGPRRVLVLRDHGAVAAPRVKRLVPAWV